MVNRPWSNEVPKWFDYIKEKLVVGKDDKELVCDLAELKESSPKTTISVFPEKIAFETQESDEQVVLTIRAAVVTNIKWVLIVIVLAISPFLIGSLEVFTSWMTGVQPIFVLILWEMVVAGYALEQILLWYYNIYIVTDKRIVDVDFHGLLVREMNDADLLKIQDVTVRSQGVGAAVFHYGDIIIQTAAEVGVFEYTEVAFPEKVASVIRLLASNREKTDNPNNDNQ